EHRDDVACWDDVIEPPAIRRADVHELDETQCHPGAFEVPRHGEMLCSFTPRLVTMLILIGPSPAACAASIPARTFATGKSTSFMDRKTASSSESRLTVTRFRPASLRPRAFS